MGAWDKGGSYQWRRTRAAVLIRDSYRCRLGLPGCTHRATQVHHTLGRAVSGDDPAHLVASCQPCNRRIGEPQGDPAPSASGTRW